MRMRRWLGFVVLVGGLGVASNVEAQAPSETDRELAVQMGRKGIDLYNGQRFEDAFDQFRNAEALVHSPVFVLYMARIEQRRGHWVAALRLFDQMMSEAPPPDAPQSWVRARKESELERADLAAIIPQLVIDAGPAPSEAVQIWVDGQMVPDWQTRPLLVDPGTHAVAGRWGQHSAHAQVQAVARNKRVVARLHFPVPLPAPSPVLRTSSPTPTTPLPDTGASTQETAGYVLLGLGGAAGLATLGVGIGALAHHSAFSDECVDNRCPRALSDDIALHDRLVTTTLGLGVSSAVLLLAGVIVDVTAPDQPRRSVSLTTDGLRWQW